MTSYIYIIKTPCSNKVYIGQTRRNIEQRFKEHKTRDIDTKLAQAFDKYGLNNFTCELLETLPNASEEQLNEREIYWIQYYNSYYQGYNMTPGGFNMESAIEATKKPIEKRDKNTFKLLQVYESVSDAARDIDASRYESIRKNICKCCTKDEQAHEVYGFRWNYVGESIDTVKRGEKRKKPVYMCDKTTHAILQRFNSAKDASTYLHKINGSQITACCRGRIKSAYGYFWQYVEEKNNEQ